LVVRVTVPVGVEVPGATSDTVTIQEDEPPVVAVTDTDDGVQVMLVVVDSGFTVIPAATVEALLL
jgi:hypothetical protein